MHYVHIERFYSRGQQPCKFIGKKESVYIPQDWFGTPAWLPFHYSGTPIWLPWRHVKARTFYSTCFMNWFSL